MRGLPYRLIPLLLTLAATAAPALADIRVSRSAGEIRYEVTVEKVDLAPVRVGGRDWTKASLKGVEGHEGVLFKEGRPEIPVVRFVVDGATTVEARAAASAELSVLAADAPLAPVQPSRVKIRGARTSFRLDQQAYEQAGASPAQAYTVENAGTVRGRARKLVTLYPVSYDAKTRKLMVRKSFTVTAKLKPARAARGGGAMAFVVGARFENSPALAAYAAFKRSQGFEVRTIVVGPGRDAGTPAEIRARLQALYRSELALDHVLLVGDAEDVPGYDSLVIGGITDHFYRAIDTDDYMSDINGPDVAVGRFAVATEEHLAAMVDKSMRYARGEFGRRQWLSGASWLATDDRWQVAEGTHNYVIDTYSAGKGYRGIFPASPQAGGDKLYAITHRARTAEVMRSVSEGRTLIQYSGHGATTYWDAPRVSPAEVRSLSDPDAMPFVVSNACITGNYRVDESFAETWTRHPQGAILFWGSMDNTFWDEDDILEKRQADGMFRDGLVRFADITDYALSQHWAHYGGAGKSKYYWETYTIFGDPSLEYRDAATR